MKRKDLKKLLADTCSTGWRAETFLGQLDSPDLVKDEMLRLRKHDNGQLDLVAIFYNSEIRWHCLSLIVQPPDDEKETS